MRHELFLGLPLRPLFKKLINVYQKHYKSSFIYVVFKSSLTDLIFIQNPDNVLQQGRCHCHEYAGCQQCKWEKHIAESQDHWFGHAKFLIPGYLEAEFFFSSIYLANFHPFLSFSCEFMAMLTLCGPGAYVTLWC